MGLYFLTFLLSGYHTMKSTQLWEWNCLVFNP